jgi:branched-chain amino acid transport system permease protein
MKKDWVGAALVPALAMLALAAMPGSTWVTLTAAGVAMGMMLFLMSAGLTLIFGLMDVLNFAHGAFITVGAYIAVSVMARLSGWVEAGGWAENLAAIGAALAASVLVNGGLGWAFERVIVRRVYGDHLRQILITMGGMIIAGQLVVALWGAEPMQIVKPALLRGSVVVLGGAVERYRIAAALLGFVVFAAMQLLLTRTRIGLLVRAGVENREMVEALGWRIRRLFVGVFMAGTALAGIGGVMWAIYEELVTAAIGADMTILVFIVVIIGGLGSVTGCFAGAVLVGLVTNYVGFLAPKLALGSTIALMALILLWRPRGLFPVAKA